MRKRASLFKVFKTLRLNLTQDQSDRLNFYQVSPVQLCICRRKLPTAGKSAPMVRCLKHWLNFRRMRWPPIGLRRCLKANWLAVWPRKSDDFKEGKHSLR
ncbi:hypothetical protein ACROYT_G009255 [Oculina patagonica]